MKATKKKIDKKNMNMQSILPPSSFYGRIRAAISWLNTEVKKREEKEEGREERREEVTI